MRAVCVVLLFLSSTQASAGWRDAVERYVRHGDIVAAVELAEHERITWLAPHLARGIPPPAHYLGWVLTDASIVVYRPGEAASARVWPRPPALDRALSSVWTALAEARMPRQADLDLLHAGLVAPVADLLAESPVWTFATDGMLSSVPFSMLTDHDIVHASSQRSAALSASRVRLAREREPSLFAYARAAGDDPDALPAARAEVALAADALAAPSTILAGPGALDALRVAAYDGTLSSARYVLFAAHASHDPSRPGVIRLELAHDEQARYAPVDTVHLQFNAELVVLSACETAVTGGAGVEGFAHAGVLAGVGSTLLTQWRVDDAASAQFVAALFTELARGRTAPEALAAVQRAFAGGEHGEVYAHPFFWAGWQLWGG